MVCFLIVAFACLRRVTTPLRSFRPLPLLSSYLAKLDGQFLLTRRLFPLPYRFTYKIATSILGKILARFLLEPLSRFRYFFSIMVDGKTHSLKLPRHALAPIMYSRMLSATQIRPHRRSRTLAKFGDWVNADKFFYGLYGGHSIWKIGKPTYLSCSS